MNNSVAAVILAFGLILAAFLNGGIYEIAAAGGSGDVAAYRLNRFTGRVMLLRNGVTLPTHPYQPSGAPASAPK